MCNEKVIYDTAPNIPIARIAHRYAIRGVVYWRDNHFTSRIIKSNGAVWYHDGILTGATCEQDGAIHALSEQFLNTCNTRGDVSKDYMRASPEFCTLLLIRVSFIFSLSDNPVKRIYI
ncbi:hypothetical protein C8J57DRAFT_1058956 [Mycena rebaudengoi]|nr:hypothetical protein C8J57DRAFT_1058956 [Mycena rebaudengoi]